VGRASAGISSIAVLVCLLLVAGCGSGVASCTSQAVAALSVTVLNASGQPVCDATVTVTDGGYSNRLRPVPSANGGCRYSGPSERRGTYSISVRRGATRAAVPGIKVTGDACHVDTRVVTVRLAE
jgi:hypothetical protein